MAAAAAELTVRNLYLPPDGKIPESINPLCLRYHRKGSFAMKIFRAVFLQGCFLRMDFELVLSCFL
jgi:hypothetical protein